MLWASARWVASKLGTDLVWPRGEGSADRLATGRIRMRFVLVALLALLLAGGGAYLLLGGGGGTDDDLYVGDDGDLTSGAGGSALLTGMEGGVTDPRPGAT